MLTAQVWSNQLHLMLILSTIWLQQNFLQWAFLIKQLDTVVYYYCSSSTVVICEPNPRFMVYLGARFCADKSDLLFAFIQWITTKHIKKTTFDGKKNLLYKFRCKGPLREPLV